MCHAYFQYQGYVTFTVHFQIYKFTVQISYVQEMCMKCDISLFSTFSFMPENAYRKWEGNVLEMSCVLATGNVPEISCVLD